MSHSIKDLLQTLADGVEGFSNAAKSVKDPSLKVVFEELSAERQEMAEELKSLSDADPADDKATVTGALHRGWINLKGAVTSGDDYAILAECERGEDHAVEVFKEAASEPVTPESSASISSISTRILAAHDKVKALRDAAKAA